MQTVATKPRLNRDARREAILDVAQQVFLEEGFAASSMSTIAARLGGSKGTLYNYFRSKDELFNAYVERRCLWQDEEDFTLKPGETVQQALQRIMETFVAHVVDDTTLRNFRLIVAEAERAPEISRTFYNTGPLRGIERLSQFLQTLERDGLLDLEGDPPGAAEHLFGMVQGVSFKGRLCNALPEPTRAQIRDQADRGVRAFLRAYGKRA